MTPDPSEHPPDPAGPHAALSELELGSVSGGAAVVDGFVGGLRDLYRGAINWGMAGVGGWGATTKLYGSDATWSTRWQTIKAVHAGLDTWGGLPSWAPRF